MGTTKVSITKQSAHRTTIPAAIWSSLTLPETGKTHSNPIGMFGGIVQQLFSEADASEKSL